MRRPLIRQLIDPHLSLLSQHIFFDLFPILPVVRSSPQHELITDNSKCKIIHCERMVFPAHHLRSHVSGSATSIIGIVLSVLSGDAKICDSHVSLRIQN